MPFIWSSRQAARGEGVDGLVDGLVGPGGWTGLLVYEVMGPEPHPAAEAAAALAPGKPARDDRWRSRDPRCPWPAMYHLVLDPAGTVPVLSGWVWSSAWSD
jgi:hypothetical protein